MGRIPLTGTKKSPNKILDSIIESDQRRFKLFQRYGWESPIAQTELTRCYRRVVTDLLGMRTQDPVAKRRAISKAGYWIRNSRWGILDPQQREVLSALIRRLVRGK